MLNVVTPHADLSSPGGFPQARPSREVNLYTLGRFTVFVNGALLTFDGRTQKKPLELLRALVIFGARGVPSSRLAKALWPNSKGDAGQHALETSLYRLRKLLGSRCITVRGGELTLNSDYCWFDVWNLESLLDASANVMSPAARVRRLFDLYREPFLEDDDSVEALIHRNRLHSKFLRVIGELGAALESQGDHEAAIECYRKSIEIDPLAEDSYRRLMLCYQTLGRLAEALAIYQRCSMILAAALNVSPATHTTDLYRQIQENGSMHGSGKRASVSA